MHENDQKYVDFYSKKKAICRVYAVVISLTDFDEICLNCTLILIYRCSDWNRRPDVVDIE